MREKIDCFLPCNDLESARNVVAQIKGSKTIQHIYLLVNESLGELDGALCDCQQIVVNDLTSRFVHDRYRWPKAHSTACYV